MKWRAGTDAYEKADPFFPDDLDDETVRRIQGTAVEAYKALKLRDYGRIDMRLAADGTPYIIEVNPNCWLSHQAEFAIAAKKAGRSYEEMIEVFIFVLFIFFIFIFIFVVIILILIIVFVMMWLVDNYWRSYSKGINLGLVWSRPWIVCTRPFVGRPFGIVVVHDCLELK